MRYLVTWEMDFEELEAPTPKDAAEWALSNIVRAAEERAVCVANGEPVDENLPLVFTVADQETGTTHKIDLAANSEEIL